VRAIFASVNILCMFANVQNLKMVFVMSNRRVPVAAARLCHSVSQRPDPTLPVDADCCRPLSGSLLLLVGGVGVACPRLLPVVACCSLLPVLLAD